MAQQQATTTKAKRSKRKPVAEQDSQVDQPPIAARTSSEILEHTVSRQTIGDEPTAEDTLGFKPYVNAVADFLLAEATKPPLTLSVEGEWGSGKSSFMRQLRKKLDDAGMLTIEFNPWRHDKEDALWAAFALHFIKEISRKLSFTRRWMARLSLLRTRYNWGEGKLDVFKAVLLVIVVIFLTAILTGFIFTFGVGETTDFLVLTQLLANSSTKQIWAAVLSWFGLGGIWLAALLTMFTKFKTYIANPLSFDLRRHINSPDYAARISFVENFHKDFKKIVDAYIGDEQAFVFVDDLDRCDVPKAADLMQAINLMISGDPRLFFVIGMDREKVAAGLAVKFEKVIPYLSGEFGDDDQSVKTGRGLEFGYNFVEKFIQIPFLVPQPKADSLATLLGLEPKKTESPILTETQNEGRTWFSRLRRRQLPQQSAGVSGPAQMEEQDQKREIRDGNLSEQQREIRRRYRLMVSNDDSTTVGEIVGWVAPFLDMNPRRIKQFINLFRLKVLIANETGLFDADETGEPLTLQQLAKFVVLTLKWPLFIRDLEREPRLLMLLSAGDVPESERTGTIERWRARVAFLGLLVYAPADAAGEDFAMKSVNAERLLQTSHHVRSTEFLTEKTDEQAHEPSRTPEANEAVLSLKGNIVGKGTVTGQLEPEIDVAQIKEKKAPKGRGLSSMPQKKDETYLSEEEVQKMLQEHNFFDIERNKEGSGIEHKYRPMTVGKDAVVLDHTTGLMWQQGGSPQYTAFEEAQTYIGHLIKQEFAGYSDWRLPTLEEAMSLMEPEKKNKDLYIDPVFDTTQKWIWTSDKAPYSISWIVYFYAGYCGHGLGFDYGYYVRAVRRQSMMNR